MKKYFAILFTIFSFVLIITVKAQDNKPSKFEQYFYSDGIKLDFNENLINYKLNYKPKDDIILKVENTLGEELYREKINLNKKSRVKIKNNVFNKEINKTNDNISLQTYKIIILDENNYYYGYYKNFNLKNPDLVKDKEKEKFVKRYEKYNNEHIKFYKIDFSEYIPEYTTLEDPNYVEKYKSLGYEHEMTEVALINKYYGVDNTFSMSLGSSSGTSEATQISLSVYNGTLGGSFQQTSTSTFGVNMEMTWPTQECNDETTCDPKGIYATTLVEYQVRRYVLCYMDWDPDKDECIMSPTDRIEVVPTKIEGGMGLNHDNLQDVNGVTKGEVEFEANGKIPALPLSKINLNQYTSGGVYNSATVNLNGYGIGVTLSIDSFIENSQSVDFYSEFGTLSDQTETYVYYDYIDTDGPKFTKFSQTTVKPSITVSSIEPTRVTIRVKNNDEISSKIYIGLNDNTPDFYIGTAEPNQTIIYNLTNLSMNTYYRIYVKAHGHATIPSFDSSVVLRGVTTPGDISPDSINI